MQVETKKLRLLFTYFILSALVIYFIFSPAIHIPFYHHDIYKYSLGGIHNSCRSDPGFDYLIRLGRPFSAILDCYSYKLGNSLDSVIFLRIICVLLIAFAMSIFAVRLLSARLFFWPAFFLSGAIFLLPAIQTTIIMAATTLIFSILMAFFAHYLVSKSCLFVRAARYKYSFHDIIYFFGGIISLFISLFTYPSLSSCFLLPALVLILFKPLSAWYQIKKIIIRDVVIFILSCLVYFIWAKSLQLRPSSMPLNYQFKLNFHFIGRMIFLYKTFPSFWAIKLSSSLVILISLIIIGGLIAGIRNFYLSPFFKHTDSKPVWVLFQIVSTTLILLVLGGLILLVVPSQDIPIGRVIFVFQAMSILILWWSMIQICSQFPWKGQWSGEIFVGILFFSGAFIANYNVATSALNDNIELNFITAMLAKHILTDTSKLMRVHIISPSVANFNGLSRGDDILNDNSTRYASDVTHIVNTALLQLVGRNSFGVYDCIFPEPALHIKDEMNCIRSAPKNSVVVTYGQSGDYIYKTKNMLIVNMDALAWPLHGLKVNE